MKALEFRVQNYRNIDNSGWISLEKVTAFVGRNESGKTSLLKALHKFNPGTKEPYDAQREFPRDRYTRDYVSSGSEGGKWPVCSVRFEIQEDAQKRIAELLGVNCAPPSTVVLTRYYDGFLDFEYEPQIREKLITADLILAALDEFASGARRLDISDEDPEEAKARRADLATWSANWRDRLKDIDDLRGDEETDLLDTLRQETEEKSDLTTADMVEALLESIDPVLGEVRRGPVTDEINDMIKDNLPVLIYFEDYGILDSAIWLPRFLEDLNRDQNDSRVRTINAMFKHVGLDPKDVAALGDHETTRMRVQGEEPTPEQIAVDQRSI